MDVKISDLEISIRTANCLKDAKIETIGDLVKKTEKEMLDIPSFGRKSLNELKEVLAHYGLHFAPEPWPEKNGAS